MKRTSAVLLLSALTPLCVCAIECPRMPEQTNADWGVEVEAAVGRIGPAKGAELAIRTKSATLNLLGRLPEADRVYLEQMMYAGYCSALKADTKMPESEKASLIRAYNKEVRSTIRQQASDSAPMRPAPVRPTSPVPAKPHLVQPPASRPSAANVSDSGTQDTSARAQQITPPTVTPPDLDAMTTVGLTTSGIDPTGSGRRDIEWKVQLRWGELFELVYPYLVGRPHDPELRRNLAAAIADRHLASVLNISGANNHRLQELSFQSISIELRSRGLVKVEHLGTTSGGSALFWGETEYGRSVIQATRKANRDAELRERSERKQFGTDPKVNAYIDAEVDRRVKDVIAKQRDAYAAQMSVLEKRLAGQVVTLESLNLPKERLKFYVEQGQVWTRVDGRLLSIESISSTSLSIRSESRSHVLQASDEWAYNTGYSYCRFALVRVDGRRALVDHVCK